MTGTAKVGRRRLRPGGYTAAMSNTPKATTGSERTRIVVAMLLLALVALPLMAPSVSGQDESPAPTASLTPAQAACASADDLRVILDFTRESVESDRGLVPVGIGVIAGLSEARNLTGLVGDVYRPLVEDLIVSLQDLRDIIGDLNDIDTVGSKVAAVGEALVDIGDAMDELGAQVRAGCPEE
jgi:hypothetical protein